MAKKSKPKAALKTVRKSSPGPELPASFLKDPGSLQEIFELLRRYSQTDFSGYKLTTISRRILRQMSLRRLTSLKKYLTYLRGHPEEIKVLAEDMFIHVTEFFRDPESFSALKEQVLSTLIKTKIAGIPLRVWVPGCSTGEEAYSLAIALYECASELGVQVPFQIFATDVSEPAVHVARIGLYTQKSLQGVSGKRLDRYFHKSKDGYKVKKAIRDLCIFSKHDITTNPPFAKIDLISCRNVLIYFDQPLQMQVLPVFHYALNSQGFLWLGRSEAPTGVSKLFSLIDKTHKIYSKVETKSAAEYRFPIDQKIQNRLSVPKLGLVPVADHQKEADRIVMSRFAPSGVVINADMEILQIRGHTSLYLELPAGQPSTNFLKLVRPELLPGIRAMIQSAQKENAAVRKEGLTMASGKERRKIDVEVIPINPKASRRDKLFLVLFVDRDLSNSKKIMGEGKSAGSKKETLDAKDVYIAELLQEYDNLRDYQLSLSEGYEATQQELTASNEELQSTLEEFQSTNEELETAKEELQAANEELTTVNSELQSRNDALIESEERFRLLVESVKDYAIFMLDPSGKVTTWNEGARRVKGYEALEIIGQHFSRFYTPEDIAAKKPEFELEKARTEGRFEEEGYRLRKDGTRFWASVIITAISDEGGRHKGFAKVTRDISQRKLVEEKLAKSEERYRLMVSVVKDYGIFQLDSSGVIATWNEGAKALSGYEPDEIIGKHFSIFYSKEDVDRGKPSWELAEAASHGRIEDEDWRLRKDGTKFWANVIISPIRGLDGSLIGFTKIIRDLTERKAVEQALRKAKEDLEKKVEERTQELKKNIKDLNKAVASRDEFLSIASHELKTPLTSLRLQAQITIRNIKLGNAKLFSEESLSDFASQLDSQVDRLSRLVEDMLDIARIQTGTLTVKFEKINLVEIIEKVMEAFSPYLKAARCELNLDVVDDIEGIWDRYRIEQVILNLLSNATKYGAGKPISLRASKENDRARLTIKDYGMGISKKDQERIFNRFERAISANEVSGLGLGLYITREIIRIHQGTIFVKSELGKGAEFIVELPLKL